MNTKLLSKASVSALISACGLYSSGFFFGWGFHNGWKYSDIEEKLRVNRKLRAELIRLQKKNDEGTMTLEERERMYQIAKDLGVDISKDADKGKESKK